MIFLISIGRLNGHPASVQMQQVMSEEKSPQVTEMETTITPVDNILQPVPHTTQTEASPEPELSIGRKNLRKWLGKTFRVVITDGRMLVGYFNCTDKDANVVLSMCAEYLEEGKDARILGNVMIPGKHIVSIAVDMPKDEALQTAS